MARFLQSTINNTTYKISAAIDDHRHLGPGLMESTYQRCMEYELNERELPFLANLALPLTYKGLALDCGYRLDLFVADFVIIEIKSVAELAPIHTAQLLTYMKLKSAPAGLLINFNVPVPRQGVKRLLNKGHEIVHQRRFS